MKELRVAELSSFTSALDLLLLVLQFLYLVGNLRQRPSKGVKMNQKKCHNLIKNLVKGQWYCTLHCNPLPLL